MSIRKVVVPPNPGLTCALGLLQSDVRCDFTKTFHRRTDQLRCEEVEREFATLEARARSTLHASGFVDARIRIQRIALLKYYGGFEAVALPITIGAPRFDRRALDDLRAQFTAEHEREYDYALHDVPLEIQLLQIVAHGLIERSEGTRAAQPLAAGGDPAAAATGERDAFFHEQDGFLSTRIYDRSRLLGGACVHGPAIVEQMDSTILIRPGMSAVVDAFGNLVIDTACGRAAS